MPTVNGPDEITTLTGGADKVFYTDSNGDVKEVSIGTDGQALISTGATAPAFEGVTGLKGGTDKVLYTDNSGNVTELALSANAGDVLTSNGATNAPIWAAPAGGDTLSFTANGALTAGNAAVLDADGKVSAAVNTLAGNTIGTTTFSNWQTATWPPQTGNSSSVYDPILDMHILLSQSYSGSFTPYYQGPSGVCVTSNSSDNTYVISSGLSNFAIHQSNSGMKQWDTWWDDTGQVALLYTSDGVNSYNYVSPMKAAGSGTGATITYGTQTNIESTATYGGSGCYVDGLSNSMVVYGTSGGVYAVEVTPAGSGATTSPTIGTPVQLDSTTITDNNFGPRISYDATNAKIVVIWEEGSTAMKYVVGTVSGGSVTWGTAANITTSTLSDNAGITICYRSADDKWFAAWSYPSSNELVTAAGTLSGSTVSWSVKKFSSADASQYKWNYITMDRKDDGLSRVTMSAYEASLGCPFAVSLGYDGANYVLNEADYPRMPNDSAGFGGTTGGGISYSPDSGKYVIGWFVWASPWNAGVYEPVSGINNTNYMIGVAQTSVTDGQTVEVKSIGTTTSAGMSGLTIRDKMYVQSNGTITSTSSSEQVGVAIAADTVLVTKIGTSIT